MPRRIFWIEDSSYSYYPVVRPLEDRGFEIEVIENMRDALARVDELRQCDLILLDIRLPAAMPPWDQEPHVGVVILQQLREQDIQTPVLAFTVVRDPDVWNALRDLGAEILSSPVLPSVLERKVRDILEEEE